MIDKKHVEIIAKEIERDAESKRMNAAMNGEMSDGGAYLLKERFRYFLAGYEQRWPALSGYENIVKEALDKEDPEYKEFERLQRKFGKK